MADYKIPADTGSGVLFWRDDKKSDRAPDLTGTIEFDPGLVNHLMSLVKTGQTVKLEVSGWSRTSAKGTEFISLSARKEYQAPSSTTRKPVAQKPARNLETSQTEDDEIPF